MIAAYKKFNQMKKIILLGLIFWAATGKSQNTVITTTILVKGNCEECKKRIEDAADIKGVKLFEWNSDTKIAKIIYKSDKTNVEAIEKAIAAAGYDTPTQSGDITAYNKLPKCCQYRTGVCDDKKK
jgi:copper chaperone CopZ